MTSVSLPTREFDGTDIAYLTSSTDICPVKPTLHMQTTLKKSPASGFLPGLKKERAIIATSLL